MKSSRYQTVVYRHFENASPSIQVRLVFKMWLLFTTSLSNKNYYQTFKESRGTRGGRAVRGGCGCLGTLAWRGWAAGATPPLPRFRTMLLIWKFFIAFLMASGFWRGLAGWFWAAGPTAWGGSGAKSLKRGSQVWINKWKHSRVQCSVRYLVSNQPCFVNPTFRCLAFQECPGWLTNHLWSCPSNSRPARLLLHEPRRVKIVIQRKGILN
jgi:hypothetical protein